MTQEEKELLLKDLCARLPYGVKLDFYSSATNEHIVCTLLGIEPEGDKPIIAKVDCGAFMFQQDHIKPYLRSMSSMTEKERFELQKAFNIKSSIIGEYGISSGNAWWVKGRKKPLGFDTIRYTSFCGVIDYLNSIHVDYRGLIEKGLALEAPKGIYD